jgi:GNAT superfamily N-acetyltransferase
MGLILTAPAGRCYKAGMPRTPSPIAADLAPGDAPAADFDWSGMRITPIRSAAHPLFHAAYARLCAEFGPRGEMETEDIIRARLRHDPSSPVDGRALVYEMLVVEADGAIVAVRDHTAIVPLARGASTPEVTLHLSHILVEPPLRGTGLSAWLRALPIQTAQEAGRAAGLGPPIGVTLVAEMEHPQRETPAVMARLRSYERAGFLKIDPDRVRYAQPDFRPASEIDRDSVTPLPLSLVVRRVGREHERTIAAPAVRDIIAALYTMFSATMEARHMKPLWDRLDTLPDAAEPLALLPPTR